MRIYSKYQSLLKVLLCGIAIALIWKGIDNYSLNQIIDSAGNVIDKEDEPFRFFVKTIMRYFSFGFVIGYLGLFRVSTHESSFFKFKLNDN